MHVCSQDHLRQRVAWQTKAENWALSGISCRTGAAHVKKVAKGCDIANQPKEQEETAAQNYAHDLSMEKPSGE